MISSMTGFGRGTAQRHGYLATVELRSVNKRFFEASVRMPSALAPYETDVQARLNEAFDRGRITVQVQVERSAEAALPLRVDEQAARAYRRLLDDLRRAAGLDEPVHLEHLLNYPDVFTTAEDDETAAEQQWEAVQEALEAAIPDLRAMRRQEGEALHADLAARIDAIEQELDAAEMRAPERVEEARERLRTRIHGLLDDDRVDPDRLELEIALLADKLDVTEECVRLRSHLQLFREALASDEPVGRKLNFIVQEIHREVNTIGSKSNDPDLAHGAVRMKEEVEKIREQVQNVE